MTDTPQETARVGPLSFDIGPKDGDEYVEYQLMTPAARAQARKTFRRMLRLAAVWGFFIPLAFGGIYALVGHVGDVDYWEFVIFGAVVWLAVWAPTFVPQRFNARVRKESLAKVRAQWPFGPRRVELREDGVFTSGPMFSGTHFWGAITEIERSHAAVVISTGEQRVIYIPARVFGSSAAADEFAATARRMMEHGKPKHPPVAHAPQAINL